MTASFVLPFRGSDRVAGDADRVVEYSEVTTVLRSRRWCLGFELGQVSRLAAIAEVLRSRARSVVLAEGSRSDALFVVLSGEVEVSKVDSSGAAQVLAKLGRGAVFGEMSFIDGLAASATVRAVDSGTRVVRIARDRLRRDPSLAGIEHQMVAELAREVVGRLRALDGNYAETVRAKVEESRMRRDLGKLFIVTVALFGIGQVTQRLITPAISPGLHMAFSWGFLLLIVAMFVAFMRAQHAPVAAFGLTGERLGKSVLEGGAAGLCVVSLFTAWKLSAGAGGPLLTWGSVAAHSPTEAALFFALYMPHCFLQELIARGVLQGSLERFLGGKYTAVLITSALFGVFHLHVSVGFALITFAASLAFGAMYRRHGNLAGVTVLHFCLGLGAVAYGMN